MTLPEKVGASVAKPTVPSVKAFIEKWSLNGRSFKLGERGGAQPHFLELCEVLGVEKPDDPENYCFERGFRKATKTRGFADVWKRGHFAWEYKAPKADLNAALQQLVQYALPLDNPPLLVVSDRLRFEIHTHFTGHPSEITTIELADLRDPKAQDALRAVFVDPYRFKPQRSNRDITEDAAGAFALIAERMRVRGIDPRRAAHFLTQCVFCFFAEDTHLLRDDVFKRLLKRQVSLEAMRKSLADLFAVMKGGGSFGVDDIEWFNGGLFNEIDVPDLQAEDVDSLKAAAQLNWRSIDPSILGTLFERGLDPSKRIQLGAHYTDPQTILRLVEPTVKKPLILEWEKTKAEIENLLGRRDYLRARAKGIPSKTTKLKVRYARIRTDANSADTEAQALFSEFLEQLRTFTVLDPACGSGNFLYVALKCLKDVEHLANFDAEELGLQRQLPVTGPQNVLGLEINSFAAELARVTVWIGELQWLMAHGYQCDSRPVLRSLQHIENRDALLDRPDLEATWPKASVIVGNPPFLGDKKMRAELGDEYTSALRTVYRGRVPGGADLVCYWFEKARAAVEKAGVGAAGLVGTNSIRGGKNREVLDAIVDQSRIFEAWSDEPWVNDGADVRVSLIAFGSAQGEPLLDGVAVAQINSDLTGSTADVVVADLTHAQRLAGNKGACFIGGMKKGAFDVPESLARTWLMQPNPNRRPNSDVLRPWINGIDIVRRPANMWIVDFPQAFTQSQAALYEAPFEYIQRHVKPARDAVRNDLERSRWWIHARTAPDMRSAVRTLKKMIVTPRNGRHRLFVKVDTRVLPDGQVVVIAREDDMTLGILHSRFHELWSLRMCTWLGIGNDPRYTPTTCFETFPFPPGLSPSDTQHLRTVASEDAALRPGNLPPATDAGAKAIASVSKRLQNARDFWLNPPDWVSWEITPGYPAQLVVKPEFQGQAAERTLTNLYNQRPAWLAGLHAELDQAVATAYGWNDYSQEMNDDEVLSRLLVLNNLPQQRRLI
jgi:type II restriction/modification system DNA methylase subunit YeeA